MTYLLDTNTCVRYLTGRSSEIRTHLESMKPQEVVLCSVVKAELFFGAARTRNPQRTTAQIVNFASVFSSMPFDDECASVYGEIRAQLEAAGTPIGPNDLMIAAIALANGLTLVTHNLREFQRVKDLLLSDWEA